MVFNRTIELDYILIKSYSSFLSLCYYIEKKRSMDEGDCHGKMLAHLRNKNTFALKSLSRSVDLFCLQRRFRCSYQRAGFHVTCCRRGNIVGLFKERGEESVSPARMIVVCWNWWSRVWSVPGTHGTRLLRSTERELAQTSRSDTDVSPIRTRVPTTDCGSRYKLLC